MIAGNETVEVNGIKLSPKGKCVVVVVVMMMMVMMIMIMMMMMMMILTLHYNNTTGNKLGLGLSRRPSTTVIR